MAERKWLDFLVLLVVSMLVVSASAIVYYALSAKSTATITSAPVTFKQGGDSAAASYSLGTNNTYVSLTFDAYPNATLTYEQAINITASANKNLRLRHVSIAPDNVADVGNWTSVQFTLINGTGTTKGTLSYSTSGNDWTDPTSTSWEAITNGEEWTIKVETKAKAGASAGHSTTIIIAVDIQ